MKEKSIPKDSTKYQIVCKNIGPFNETDNRFRNTHNIVCFQLHTCYVKEE